VTKLLIVEDEPAILSAMCRGFEFEGFEVVMAVDGRDALARIESERPDLVVLDVMLPKLNGIDVCKQLREAGEEVPIILLTARDQEMDKVLGLRSGADDYVTKPFSFLELLARVEAVLRRRPAGAQTGSDGAPALRLDAKRMEVYKGERKLELSKREFRILEYFVDHRDEIVTRERLLDDVWGYDAYPFSRTVDTHIAKLRKKLEEDPSDPKLIVTVHGIGYKFTG
jgi:two-component system alkaline phosphatase synthesis response regulator PhoP